MEQTNTAAKQEAAIGQSAEILAKDYGAMVKRLAKSGDVIAQELTGQKAHMLHMAVGIAGEAAELMEAFYVPQMLEGVELDMTNVIEEMGDLEFYMEGLSQALAGEEMNDVFGVHGMMISEETDLQKTAPGEEIKRVQEVVIMAGTLLDTVKKYVVYNKPEMLPSICSNIVAMEYYMEQVYEMLKLSRTAVMISNMNKLATRYGMHYSDQSAQQRVDKVEVQHTETGRHPTGAKLTEAQQGKPVYVYKIDDCDWWASHSSDLQQVIVEYAEYTGMSTADFDGEPELLNAEEMAEMKFAEYAEEGSTAIDSRTVITFQQKLNSMIMSGEEFPCLFASTEY